MNDKCPNKAEYVAAWGGKLQKGCETHIKDLRVLGRVIGSSVDVQPIVTDEPCFGRNDFEERRESK